MDPLTEALQAVLGLFGGSGPVAGPPSPGTNPGMGQPGGIGSPSVLSEILPLLLTGLQTSGAIQYGGSELDALQNIYNLQKQAARMSMAVAPGQLGVQAARMAQPLNKQLAYQVSSAANANSALRGLSQAPGAMAAGEAAALAPFEQQNLQTGAQLATSADQIAIDRLNPAFRMNPPDYGAVLAQLSRLGEGSTAPPFMYGQLPGGAYFPGVR